MRRNGCLEAVVYPQELYSLSSDSRQFALQSVDCFPMGIVHHEIFIFHRSKAKREHMIFKIPSGEEMFPSDARQFTFQC